MIESARITVGEYAVDVVRLVNANGVSAKIIGYGATLTELLVPDRNGNFANVVLGFDDLSLYFKPHPYFGCIVGRYTNRVAGGQFEVDGIRYFLATNEGNNTLHSGPHGFHSRLWRLVHSNGDQQSVTLSYESPDMEEGFPGKLVTDITYSLSDNNELRIHYNAVADRTTPVNLTHHSYFNLGGAGTGDILDHQLSINALEYTEVDEEQIPTGRLVSLSGPLDFAESMLIGARIADTDFGYDHNYVLNNNGKFGFAARLYHPQSGRFIEMHTSEPGLQFYSGNHLDGTITGNGGIFNKHGGLCLEAQHFPDSVHHKHFPSTLVSPARPYQQLTVYKFGVV